jgi:major membrane immunogen (membrane-anchored lipoprotein)
MLTIKELEQAVSSLPREELARFREWFDEFDAKAWDKQLEADAKTGKLTKIADSAIADYRAGKAKGL